MGYREVVVQAPLRELVECLWTSDRRGGSRILPDGCMDLIEVGDAVLVAGPDTTAFISDQDTVHAKGIRFHPGALPRLLGIPASELRNTRIPLRELRPDVGGGPLLDVTMTLLRGEPADETTPWPLPQLAEVTDKLAHGAAVHVLADEMGWSARSLQRQCAAVYGYGPATVRRVLRFRNAVGMLRADTSVTDTAARAGYSDAPHLYREIREFAGVGVAELRQDSSAANRSTVVPSGSVTVA
ncbi:AraC family transcriptional regulator [Mycolicibacterium komossense]|uniref:AraC family transcriptional regulator n=1 Tax=Mycolicibacterium komossense TaxID=1779 RepID=A0ABT3CMW8_9MYCO|nr:helix-turn-helix domain-containing protein [Mycolicibacterium komossense]MCV7230764.1 AraC family transcriptional regulator [Mycolicibacterium komossense]